MSPTALLISSIVLFLAVGLAFGCVEHFRPARRLRTDGRWLLSSLLGVVLLLWISEPLSGSEAPGC